MSGFEIFGAIAGGFALCNQLVKLGIAVREAIQRIKNSRQDALDLSDEAVIFAGLCTQFLQVCDEDHNKNKAIHSSIHRLIGWLKKLEIGLYEVLQKAGALLPDPTNKHSIEKRWIARLEWFGSKKEVESLRASMSIARTSIDGFSNLICIRKLNEELKMLKLALVDAKLRERLEKKFGMTLNEKIGRVRQSVGLHCSVHEVKERVLKSAIDVSLKEQQSKGTSEFDITRRDLSVFTKAFETYGKQILPVSKHPRYRSGSNDGTISDSEATLLQATPRNSRSRNPNSNSTLGRPLHTSRNITTISGHTKLSQTPFSTVLDMPIVEVSIRPDAEPVVSRAEGETTRQVSTKERSDQKETISAPLLHGLFKSMDIKSREYINDPDGNILSPPKVKSPLKNPLTKLQKIGRHTIMLSATEFRINGRSFGMSSYETADDLFSAILLQRDLVDELVKVVNGGYGNILWDGIPGWFASPGKVTRPLKNSGIKLLQGGQSGA
ncbi:hypothetical protein HBH92_186350 [Parastagonospora nodorum]|nr:hypothetical protein HBH52_200820 [Parastagonospora nodorum]KAH4002458.1 hypothetical protein HBI10_075730 [Parastagonospora nodorum]KAH4025922.1 hypothetical protein HBI13_071540 [Parastagonospora nodorum]KAH4062498.1 hypothetical protein HBH50_204050 [Parastagonospora nodorum]KAH4081053.1 hypothetical protein HBH48_199690 [Parastagonospora nodorum]